MLIKIFKLHKKSIKQQKNNNIQKIYILAYEA